MRVFTVELDCFFFSALTDGRSRFVVLKENPIAPYVPTDQILFKETMADVYSKDGSKGVIQTGNELLTEITYTMSSSYFPDAVKPGYMIVSVRPVEIVEAVDFKHSVFSKKEKHVLYEAQSALLTATQNMKEQQIDYLEFRDKEPTQGVYGVVDQGDLKKYPKSMILNIARALYEIQKSKISRKEAKKDEQETQAAPEEAQNETVEQVAENTDTADAQTGQTETK